MLGVVGKRICAVQMDGVRESRMLLGRMVRWKRVKGICVCLDDDEETINKSINWSIKSIDNWSIKSIDNSKD